MQILFWICEHFTKSDILNVSFTKKIEEFFKNTNIFNKRVKHFFNVEVI